MVSPKKIKVCLSVSAELFTQYRQFLAEKFGEVRKGLISSEIEQAISVYMAEHERSTHTQGNHPKRSPNPPPRVRRVQDEVTAFLKGEFGYKDVYQVPLHHVKEAISMTQGTDPRTIKRWLNAFESCHLMYYVGENMVEFV